MSMITDSHCLVTVMIPAFNAAVTLPDTLRSVHRQTHRPIELVIVNDGSTDATTQIVAAFEREHASDELKVVSIKQPNSGLVATRRRGLAASTGTYLQFLDADDVLHPEKFAKCLPFLENGGYDVVVPRTDRFRNIGEIEPSLAAAPAQRPWKVRELKGSTITTNLWHSAGPLFKREIVLRSGGFPRNVNPVIEELEFHGRIKLLNPSVYYLPDVLNYYRVGNPASVTGTLDRLYRGRIEGGSVARELLVAVGNISRKEWSALMWMTLRTAYQAGACSSDPRLQKDAWMEFVETVRTRSNLPGRIIALIPWNFAIIIFRLIYKLRGG